MLTGRSLRKKGTDLSRMVGREFLSKKGEPLCARQKGEKLELATSEEPGRLDLRKAGHRERVTGLPSRILNTPRVSTTSNFKIVLREEKKGTKGKV